MLLLDTNVVSELRKSTKTDPNVKKWADAQLVENLYLSAVSILELEIGILFIERRDWKQGAVLRAWMDGHVLHTFSDRILPVDTAVAQRCAVLHVPNPRSDRDALIGATALVHKMAVVTRNSNDFHHFGVTVINPWEL